MEKKKIWSKEDTALFREIYNLYTYDELAEIFNCSRNIVSLSAKHDKENPIYVYYQKKKQEGKHYYACLTACSTKLIRIIYALCMNNSNQQD